MRVKSLLVGAEAGFVGPWVSLEDGEWLVGPFPGILQSDADGKIYPDKNGFVIVGPIRIHAIVDDDYVGEEVFLQAKEQERESDAETNEVSSS